MSLTRSSGDFIARNSFYKPFNSLVSAQLPLKPNRPDIRHVNLRKSIFFLRKTADIINESSFSIGKDDHLSKSLSHFLSKPGFTLEESFTWSGKALAVTVSYVIQNILCI